MKRKTDIYNKDRLMSQITKNTIKKKKRERTEPSLHLRIHHVCVIFLHYSA